MGYRIEWLDNDTGETYTGTLHEFGAVKLISDQRNWRGDAFWMGRELVVMNGAISTNTVHNNPIKRMNGHLRIIPLTDTDDGATYNDATIYDGQGLYHAFHVPNKLRLAESDQWFTSWHSAAGPSLDDVPGWLWEKVKTWGPAPVDIKDPGETGSPRNVRCRSMAVHKLLHAAAQGEEPCPALMADSQRWVHDQYRRQVHYYDWETMDVDMPGFPRQFVATDYPEARVGWGYRSPGGFSDTRGATEFFGRTNDDGTPWEGNRDLPFPMDHMHLETFKLLAIAMLTKSGFALWHAVASVEANHSHLMSGQDYAQARSQGWVAETYTMCMRVCDTYRPQAGVRFSVYLNELLTDIEENMVHYPKTRLTFPTLSPHKVGKTGHMEMTPQLQSAIKVTGGGAFTVPRVQGIDDIEAYINWVNAGSDPGTITVDTVFAEYDGEKGGEFGRGLCVWMAGIMLQGLDKVLEWGSWTQRERAQRIMDLLAPTMSSIAEPRYWIDQHTLDNCGDTAPYGVLADVSGIGVAKPSTVNAAGTALSFAVPGFEVLIRRYQLDEPERATQGAPILTLIENMLVRLEDQKYWGSSGHPDRGRMKTMYTSMWETARRKPDLIEA